MELTKTQRRQLYSVYKYLISLSKKATTPASEALEGDGTGVASGDAQRQPRDHYTVKGASGQNAPSPGVGDADH